MKKGFTLIELMIVIAIIAIIAAIAIPSLLENQKAANDNAAQAMLKAIVTSQATYTTQFKRYAPTLAILASSGILQKDGFSNCTAAGSASQVISGYTFEMTAGKTWTATSFFVRCKPESTTAGNFAYATDTNGKIVSTTTY